MLKFTKLQTSDRLIDQIQTNLGNVINPIASNLLVQGHFINNVILIAGITNIIPTGLNQNLNGWMITRLRGNSIIWDEQDTNPTPNQNLQLICSANVTVDLYIF